MTLTAQIASQSGHWCIGPERQVGVGNLAPSPFALDPLLELQKAFCLFCFDSQLRIGVHKEITDIMAGQRAEDINMYKLMVSTFCHHKFCHCTKARLLTQSCSTV